MRHRKSKMPKSRRRGRPSMTDPKGSAPKMAPHMKRMMK